MIAMHLELGEDCVLASFNSQERALRGMSDFDELVFSLGSVELTFSDQFASLDQCGNPDIRCFALELMG